MKLLARWALICVAANLLLFIAIIGVRHCGTPPRDRYLTDATDHFRATRLRPGPVGLVALARTAASPTTEVELARGGRVDLMLTARLASIAGTGVDLPAKPTDRSLMEISSNEGLAFGSLTSTSLVLPEPELAGDEHSAIDIQRLYALKASIHRRVRALRGPEGSGLAAVECPRRAYDLAELDRLAEAGLADLLSLIPVQAEPLRAFVRSSYPKPTGVEVPYACFSQGGLVSPLAADNFLSEVEALHDRFAREPAITIDLFIKSSPPGGSYILRSIHTEVGRVENTTNSSARAYRGIYDFSVTRSGYKPAHLRDIDLINSTPHIIDCQLRAVKDADESTCQLR